MPYKKSYKKRSYGRRTNWGKTGRQFGSALSLASKAWRAAKYVKSLINVERKFCDSAATAITPVLTTGAVDRVTDVQEGSDYNQRTGLSIKATSWFVRGRIALLGATPLPTNLRILMIQDMDNTGSAPTTADILETITPDAPINHTNGKRFRVCHDKIVSLSNSGTDSVHFKMYSPSVGHIRYSNATTGTREGQCYMVYLSDGNTATSFLSLTYYSRIRFIDN